MKKAFTVALTVMFMAGCGSSEADDTASDIVGEVTTSGITPERCDANKRAGQITYLTGFDFAASAGIIDAVVADQLGYFKKMCLDVKVQSGFDTSNIPLVSAGQAQLTALGSTSEIADAAAKDGNIHAIAVLGHKAVEELVVLGSSQINKVGDLKDTTMGVLGTIPFSIRVMMARNGVLPADVKQVEAGFNPLLLTEGTFASRPVYKSNEPRQLKMANVATRSFDPSSHDVTASFAAIVVNKDFARQHPTATEDFLRAQLKGFEYAMANPTQAVDMTFAKADPKYYLTKDGENFRWDTERLLVQSSTPSGKPFGYIDAEEIRNEVEPLVTEVNSLPSMPDVKTLYDDSHFTRIHDGTTVIWPTS
jgi:ABC-type nitrate/sulfonate/bicarbonate transport system substrate-binding protein